MMESFTYARASDVQDALSGFGERTALLAGGTELLNWMRLGIEHPAHIVDISRLQNLRAIENLPGASGLRIGALATLNEVALHPRVAHDFPALSEACLKAASAQLRNLATLGGNLLQRTRCPYFRSDEVLPCNRRVPGSGCAARDGINEKHAIFGWTDACVAVQPSDPAVALAALDANIVIASSRGTRRVSAAEFHVLPTDDPSVKRHTVIEDDELITAIELPSAMPNSAYLKVRERESYEFAIASAAAALELGADGSIRLARIALGSVAMRPWRLRTAERELQGKSVAAPEVRQAIEHEFAAARALSHNAHKIVIARNAAWRALQLAAQRAEGGAA
jgi:xanthine dehydrogenase YagS FAD-binding subunit